MQEALIPRLLQGHRARLLPVAGILIGLIAFADWHFEENISFGFLYLFPLLIVGGSLRRWQIVVVAAICAALSEAFDPFPWTLPLGVSRLILSFAAFVGAGLYGHEFVRTRRLEKAHLEEIESEVTLRRTTEEQLQFLISSSPAAIFTLDGSGRIMLANDAAHRLLRVETGDLEGQPINRFIPALAAVPSSAREAPVFHTKMECRGHRQDGEVFIAHVWFSTYATKSGPRLAAIAFDTSEELRDRAEFSMQQILSGSKVLVGALCHEIRNVCGAIGVVHAKLVRDGQLQLNEDFQALGTLVEGLEKMAGLELRQTTKAMAGVIDIRSVLEELRIIVEPSFQEEEISVHWDLTDSPLYAWADRQALLQAFLNIVKNSQRALEGQETKEMVVRTSMEEGKIVVRFFDSGPGVSDPARLFEPFQPGAQASGLGLYLSRTFVRAFQAELLYEPQVRGCCFAVSLAMTSDRQLQAVG